MERDLFKGVLSIFFSIWGKEERNDMTYSAFHPAFTKNTICRTILPIIVEYAIIT